MRGSAKNVTGFVEAEFSSETLATEPAPKMHLEVPVEQFRSGNALQDHEMWKMIDSRRFPTIMADLRSLESAGAPGSFKAGGDITLAGRQRHYDGTLTVTRDGDNLKVEGDLVVDIRDFGVHAPRILMLKVEPQVQVHLRLVAAAQK